MGIGGYPLGSLGMSSCCPLTKFLRVLGHTRPLLGLRQLAKEGVQCKAENREVIPILVSILGFWVDVMGKGCRPVGLPMFRSIL
jgi:hypothetical protein